LEIALTPARICLSLNERITLAGDAAGYLLHRNLIQFKHPLFLIETKVKIFSEFLHTCLLP